MDAPTGPSVTDIAVSEFRCQRGLAALSGIAFLPELGRPLVAGFFSLDVSVLYIMPAPMIA